MDDPRDDRPDALEALLDRLHDSLLSADFAALPGLAEEIGATADMPRSTAAARRLGEKARRNARSLEAAGKGIRSARRRLEALDGGSTLATYDGRGRRLSTAAGEGGLRQRL